MPAQTFVAADLSALDPSTIDPRQVGARAAIENFAAFLIQDCVKRGQLSRADAASGFDRFCDELGAMLSRECEG